jgi:hypothetical protein
MFSGIQPRLQAEIQALIPKASKCIGEDFIIFINTLGGLGGSQVETLNPRGRSQHISQ